MRKLGITYMLPGCWYPQPPQLIAPINEDTLCFGTKVVLGEQWALQSFTGYWCWICRKLWGARSSFRCCNAMLMMVRTYFYVFALLKPGLKQWEYLKISVTSLIQQLCRGNSSAGGCRDCHHLCVISSVNTQQSSRNVQYVPSVLRFGPLLERTPLPSISSSIGALT